MDKKEIEEGNVLSIDFDKRGGLVPVIAQNARDGAILMLAYANREAFEETARSGMATFWSTSRNQLWKKGETSGDCLRVVEILVDCDQDAIIYKVEPQGRGACHTKDPDTGSSRTSCFYRKLDMRKGTLTPVDNQTKP